MLGISYVMEIGQNSLLQHERLGLACLKKKKLFSSQVPVLNPVKCKEGFIGRVYIYDVLDYQNSLVLVLCPCYLCLVKISEVKSCVIQHILKQ